MFQPSEVEPLATVRQLLHDIEKINALGGATRL